MTVIRAEQQSSLKMEKDWPFLPPCLPVQKRFPTAGYPARGETAEEAGVDPEPPALDDLPGTQHRAKNWLEPRVVPDYLNFFKPTKENATYIKNGRGTINPYHTFMVEQAKREERTAVTQARTAIIRRKAARRAALAAEKEELIPNYWTPVCYVTAYPCDALFDAGSTHSHHQRS
jgi:hypothetical protein